MKLYEIVNDYNLLYERLEAESDPEGIKTLTDTLESLEGELMDKLAACCAMVKNFEAEGEACAAEVKRLNDMKRVALNKAEALKSYLRHELERTGAKTTTVGVFRCSFRNNTVVEVDDPNTLPAEFQRITVAADKTALKKALQDGATIDGARLATSTTFSVR